MTKDEKGYPKEQHSLSIMDTFKGQDSDTLKELCFENNCKIVGNCTAKSHKKIPTSPY